MRIQWAVALLFAFGLRADVLVVASSGASHVTLIDPASGTKLAEVPVGKGPHEVIASADGRFAWVADSGATTVTLVDLDKRSAVRTLQLKDCGPHDLALPRSGSPLLVTCATQKALLEIDPWTGEEVKRHALDVEGAWMTAVSRDGARAFTANLEGGGMTAIDRKSGRITNLHTSEGEIGIDVTPDAREVWLANSKTSKVTVFDANTLAVLATFETGAQSPSRVRFTSDGKRAVMTFGVATRVGVYDVAKRKAVRWIDIDSGSKVLTISPDGRKAAVSAPHKDTVMILDLVSGKMLAKIDVAGKPDGVAWAAQEPAPQPLPSIALPPEADRVLRDYEKAWQNKDAAALAALFAEDGFVLSNGKLPVRGRAAIQQAYADGGGPLALRALAYSLDGATGYIIGAYGRTKDSPDDGKFILALKKDENGRWLIAADIDNTNSRPKRPAAPPS